MVRELQAALPSARAGSLPRLEWLGHHLDLYVDRLVGFAAVPNVPVPSLVASDLFACVAISAELLQAELETAPRSDQLAAAWSRLKVAVAEVTRLRQSSAIDELRLAAVAWKSSLGASGG